MAWKGLKKEDEETMDVLDLDSETDLEEQNGKAAILTDFWRNVG